MKKRFHNTIALLLWLFAAVGQTGAAKWVTHLAYNDVNQIAAGDGRVYGVSSGSLFAIDAQTEDIITYSHVDGLHGTTIVCIHQLEPSGELMIAYEDGKIDLLKNGVFTYIPDLYRKVTTLNKSCNNIYVRDSLAYMAMNFGILTYNIGRREFVDTYFIGAEGAEVSVKYVTIASETIYAASGETLYAANMHDNIVDYAYWSEVELPSEGSIKGLVSVGEQVYLLVGNTCYRRQGEAWQEIAGAYKVLNVIDGELYGASYPAVSLEGVWFAEGANGVERLMPSGERVQYRLDGPLSNNPYRLNYAYGQLFMVEGGRWAVQNYNPGNVMRFDGEHWHNTTSAEILSVVGGYCYDFMNTAVDPQDQAHFFVTSYGTGLYEFRNDSCLRRWGVDNSIIGAAAANDPARYTRLDGAIYDGQGNLWMMNSGSVTYNIVIFAADGRLVGLNLYDEKGDRFATGTVGLLSFDRANPNRVWVVIPRGKDGLESGVALIDTNGTIDDPDDDENLIRFNWTDADGAIHTYTAIYDLEQDAEGNKWIATNNGVFILPAEADYFSSNACRLLELYDESGSRLFEGEVVNAIATDYLQQIWIGTATQGIYVLNAEGDAIVEHFTTENSALPSNCILSLAAAPENKTMYVGSGLGLVSYIDIITDVERDNANSGTAEEEESGSMFQWTSHLAYTDVNALAITPTKTFALSAGALCGVNKSDESLTYYSKLTGLNGSTIHSIHYHPNTRQLLITYEDGLLDLLDEKEVVHAMPDIYLKQLNTSKQVQCLAFDGNTAYLGMSFGILSMSMSKLQISDTYFIGSEASETSVTSLAVLRDTLYAVAEGYLYRGALGSKLVDFAQWDRQALGGLVTAMAAVDDHLYMLMDSVLYVDGAAVPSSQHWAEMNISDGRLLLLSEDREVYTCQDRNFRQVEGLGAYSPSCVAYDNGGYWIGSAEGVLYVDAARSVQRFEPDGPCSNMPYAMTSFGSEVWSVPGGRWAYGYLREGQISHFDGTRWQNLPYQEICRRLGYTVSLYDLGHVAVDPADPKHFYVSTFGTGLLEFKADGSARRYNHDNSPLVSLVNTAQRYRYCRVDAIAFDSERNLWLTNTGSMAKNIHIIDPNGTWHSFDIYGNGQRIVLSTINRLLIDNRNPNYKWFASAREPAGVVLLNDNGTPYQSYDDRAVQRYTFIDQDSKSVTISKLMCLEQDHNGDVWLGTNEGIVVIDAATDLFRTNACRRLKISRHDGTNLADYLLGTEQINAIAFAGGNRIWIGTEASGVYLIHMVTKEGIYEPEVISHFTTANSPMPSDCVLSLALDRSRGEVYIGTASGLVSYRFDATDPASDMSGAYVYPNPVRPNYTGAITINGLMDETTVYIADAAGNVVCRTQSNGGTAVWDGKTLSGSKAHSGVYTVYCNTADGKSHTVLKLMLIN